VFDGLNRISTKTQVDGSLSGEVSFGYASGALGGRLTKMVYPNGRVLNYGYDGDTLSSTLDDTSIGRLSFLADDDGTSTGVADSTDTRLETYEYLGLDTVVVRTHPEANSSGRWRCHLPRSRSTMERRSRTPMGMTVTSTKAERASTIATPAMSTQVWTTTEEWPKFATTL
jgi:hypothetical protein